MTANTEGSRAASASVWVLAVLLAVVPLATANLTGVGLGRFPLLYDSVALPRLVLSVLGALLAWVLWFVSAARAEKPAFRFDWVLGALVALGLWAAISAAASPHRALAILGQSERLEGVVTIGFYAVLYGIALQVTRGDRDLRLVVTGLGFAAIVSALYGVAQFLGFDPTSYLTEGIAFGRQAFATFGNPNFLAGLLVLALPCVVALAITAARRWSRAAWAFGAVVVGLAILATFTRGAWLAVIVQAAAFVVIWRRGGSRLGTAERWIAVAVAAVMIGAVALSATMPAETNVLARLADIGTKQGSAGERLLVLATAVAAAGQQPVLGYGPDSFLAAFRQNRVLAYSATFSPTATINNAHSWPMQLAVTLGLVGGLLVVLAIVVALWRAGFLVLRRSAAPVSTLVVGVWIGCLGFGVSMFFNVAVQGATTPFWVLLGALGALSAQEIVVSRGLVRSGLVLGIVVLVASVLASTSILRADNAFLRSRLAVRGMLAEDPLVSSRRAVQLNPLTIKYARGAAAIEAAAVDRAIASRVSQADVRDLYARADAAFARAQELDSADYATLAWRAALQATVARYTGDSALAGQAAATARQAAALDRDHVEVRALSGGDTSAAAASEAALVPALP